MISASSRIVRAGAISWWLVSLPALAGCGDDLFEPMDGAVDGAPDGSEDGSPPVDGPGCEDGQLDGMFSRPFWNNIDELSPPPGPLPSPGNDRADDPDAATLGQRLFFETDYSGPLAVGDDGSNGGLGAAGQQGQVSCASCHVPDSWFSDTRSMPNATSLGADWTARNAPPLVDAALYEVFGWAGRSDSMWAESLRHVERPEDINGSRLAVAHVLYDQYREDYDAVFEPDLPDALSDTDRFPPEGKPGEAAWDDMADADKETINEIFANFGKALEAYMRRLMSGDSDFDRYVAEVNASCTSTAIPEAAKRGLRVFVGKAGCSECHEGADFTDNDFHNLGIPQEGTHVADTDQGRYEAVPALLADPFNLDGPYSDDRDTGRLDGLEQAEEMRGEFRTKLLRNMAETGPYMHTGGFDTPRDVVELYDMGGEETGFVGTKDAKQVALNLTEEEKSDLVAFLGTLTGAPVPPELREDTSR